MWALQFCVLWRIQHFTKLCCCITCYLAHQHHSNKQRDGSGLYACEHLDKTNLGGWWECHVWLVKQTKALGEKIQRWLENGTRCTRLIYCMHYVYICHCMNMMIVFLQQKCSFANYQWCLMMICHYNGPIAALLVFRLCLLCFVLDERFTDNQRGIHFILRETWCQKPNNSGNSSIVAETKKEKKNNT